MPDPIVNKPNDTNMSSLDDVSLDSIHNPSPDAPATPPAPVAPVVTPDNTDPAKPALVVATPADVNNDDADDNTDDNDIIIKDFDGLLSVLTTKDAKDLSEAENSELLSIIDSFGGEAFNKDGAIVNADGKVLYTTEQVKEFLTTDELPVDAEGNFVNADGEIVKTKVELYRANTTVGTVMNALATNFDLDFSDTYLPTDTEDGIIEVVNGVANVLRSTAVAEYFEANPELEAFRKHLVLHGKADGYKSNSVEYSKIDVKTLSKDAGKIYITEAYKASGRDLTPAYSKYLDSLEEEDFNVEVKANLDILNKVQLDKQKEVDAQIKQKQQDQAIEAKQYWDSVTNTIKSGKLSNINIPLADREGFLAYVTKPVQNGKSQDILDAEKEDVTSDLLMSFFRYKGKDISALARNIATTDKVEGLRERMAKNNKRNTSSDKGHKPRTQDGYIPSLGEVVF